MGAVTVNMVSADLSHEETILQIADALDTLDKVILMLISIIKLLGIVLRWIWAFTDPSHRVI